MAVLLFATPAIVVCLVAWLLRTSAASNGHERQYVAQLWSWNPAREAYVIPYHVDPSYEDDAVSAICWALGYLESRTNFKFDVVSSHQKEANDPSKNYLVFLNSDSPQHVTVGRRGGPQEIHLAERNVTPGRVLYHMMQVMGFRNEYQRKDRDAWITLRPSRVFPQYRHLFGIFQRPCPTGCLTPYDYASKTHFIPSTLYIEPPLTETAKAMHATHLGARAELSSCDVYMINTVYPGSRRPGICIPGQVTSGFTYTQDCLRELNIVECAERCWRWNDLYFMGNVSQKHCKVDYGLLHPPPPPDVVCS